MHFEDLFVCCEPFGRRRCIHKDMIWGNYRLQGAIFQSAGIKNRQRINCEKQQLQDWCEDDHTATESVREATEGAGKC